MSMITLEELEIAKNHHYRHVDDAIVQHISTDNQTYQGGINSVGKIINMKETVYHPLIQSIVTEVFTILQCFSLIDEYENRLCLHIGYQPIDETYYIEFSFNYNFNLYLKKNHTYYQLLDQIYKQLSSRMMEDKFKVKFIRPIIESPESQISDRLTTFTISYWKSLSGFYEYINNLDRMNTFLSEIRIYMDDKEYENKMNQLSKKVNLLDNELEHREFSIPTAFHMYKQFLSELFQIEEDCLPVSKIDEAYYCITLN